MTILCASATVFGQQPDRPFVAAAYQPSNVGRVGVQQAQPLPMSLEEAIRRALEGNNSIEVSRGDVRFQATRYRSLLGIYDPVLTAQPTFTRNSITGSTPTRDLSINADVFQFIRPGGGNYQVFLTIGALRTLLHRRR